MISLGMDSWKTLSNKNKNIYIQPTEQEAEQAESLRTGTNGSGRGLHPGAVSAVAMIGNIMIEKTN